MSQWRLTAALLAACSLAQSGCKARLIIEERAQGGWHQCLQGEQDVVPAGHYAKAARAEDSREAAKAYLTNTLFGEDVPEALIDAYLDNGPKMLRCDRTDVRYESLELAIPTTTPIWRARERGIGLLSLRGHGLGAWPELEKL